MKIVKTRHLSEQQKRDALFIERSCINQYHMTLSLPLEDATLYGLLYDPDPVCILALTPEESIAFTLPEKQRKGYFTALMSAFEEDIADTDLIFYTDHSNEGAVKALECLDAELISNEFKMVLSMKDFAAAASAAEESCISRLTALITPSEDGGSLSFLFQEGTSPDIIVGSACAVLYESSACLHDFEIHTDLRRRGFGLEALLLFLTQITERGMDSVSLHVAGENEAAVKLYKKTGFRISEALSCYLY